MPKIDVTYNQVESIANKILLAGEVPSVGQVHLLLGKVGRRETVKKYLKEWSTKYASEIDKLTKPPENPQTLEQQVELRTQELKQSLSLVRATLESTTDAILMIDLKGKMVDWNQKFVNLLKVPQEVLESGNERAGIKFILDQVEDPEGLMNVMMRLAANPTAEGDIGEIRCKDGRIFERYSQPTFVGDKIVGRVYSFRDVTERRKAEEALRLRERAIEASTHGVIITDNGSEQKILYANPAFEKITGYNRNEIIGQSYQFLQAHDQEQPELKSLHIAIKEQREEQVILRSYRKDGSLFWNEMHIAPVPDPRGNVGHFVGIINDITERKAMESQLIHQATHDALTDLPNRVLLQDRINQAILYTKRYNCLAAVLFLDLDRFKLINDSLGHKMGDGLLCAVSKRLKTCLRNTDTIARIGGDEFIIILSPLHRIEESILITQKILVAIREPFQIEERELIITGSIGISCYPKDGVDADTLVQNADTAMYQAKDLGRDNFQFFTDEMNRSVSQRLQLENSLHRALDREEFSLVYQPILNLQSGHIIGTEALLRWDHPELGRISPLEFIPMAEEIGLIIPIGAWVLKTACQQMKMWQKAGFPNLQISVNLSSRQLKDSDIVQTVRTALHETQLNAHFLILELTESMLMDYSDETIEKLQKLQKMGVQIAIDDFGTGYSSLSYLKKLPVNKIKIDQSFIQDISVNAEDMAITLAIIAMSKQLGLIVVAEGTQTKRDMDFLREHQCDEVQGYYFSKPIDAETCSSLIKENLGLLGKSK